MSAVDIVSKLLYSMEYSQALSLGNTIIFFMLIEYPRCIYNRIVGILFV